MNSKNLVIKTLEFDSPERIPRHLWTLPWAERNFPRQVKNVSETFPDDILSAPVSYLKPVEVTGDRYEKGLHVDEWGCRFTNIHDGVIGIVKDPVINNWSDLADFKAPEEVLSIDVELVNDFCRKNEKFVVAGSFVRPFERLSFIRTMEQALMDVMIQNGEFFELLKIIHNHYLKETEIWASTDVDAIALMDDWGTQHGLMVSPQIWRKIFKPLYREYVEIAKAAGKYVFLHSDGNIMEIIPDLIEIGIDALNSQIYCMGVPQLGKEFAGKITFWGEIDRQHLLPFAGTSEIREAVIEVHRNLYCKGGVIAQCEFGPGAKPENIFEVFKTWQEINLINGE